MAVLVYTENWDGQFKKLSFELVSYASKIAEMFNTKTIAVSIGKIAKTELNKLGNYGCDKIISIEDDRLKTYNDQIYARVLAEVANKENAEVLVLSHNSNGKALASRLSVRLKASLGSGLYKLPESIEPFIVSKKVFSGKAIGNVVLNTKVRILTLAQNSFELIETQKSPEIVEYKCEADINGNAIVSKDIQRQSGKIILTDAEIVVSGGRGMKSPSNWGVIEELAELLGAATACSRPVSDDGWRPHHEHTGQTGKIISPNLYIAAGISGAIQHMAGISSSKYIVAINTDRDAPIFESADYGIVGDALKVLPELISAIKKAKS